MSIDTVYRPVYRKKAWCDFARLADFSTAALALQSSGGLAQQEVDTVTISGSPTGGNFTVSVNVNGGGVQTATIAQGASANTAQSAIQGLSNVGAGNAFVSLAGSVYTIVFQGALGATPGIVVTASGAGLTGGTSPAATAAQVTAGQAGLNTQGATEMLLTVNVTALSGTSPTLTLKLQTSDDGGTTWYDLPNAGYVGGSAPTAINAVGKQVIQYTAPLGQLVRAYATVGGSSNPTVTGYVNYASK